MSKIMRKEYTIFSCDMDSCQTKESVPEINARLPHRWFALNITFNTGNELITSNKHFCDICIKKFAITGQLIPQINDDNYRVYP